MRIQSHAVLLCAIAMVTMDLNSCSTTAMAQPSVGGKVCGNNDFWADCAKKVKTAISQTNDPKVALGYAAEWGDRFDQLYRANVQRGWAASDQERLKQAMDKLWEESIGQYLDPAGLGLAPAIKRYLPSAAAALEWASAPQTVMFYTLLAPSPIANSFTEARPINTEINALLASKLPSATRQTIKDRYPELFRKAFEMPKTGTKMP